MKSAVKYGKDVPKFAQDIPPNFHSINLPYLRDSSRFRIFSNLIRASPRMIY